MNLLDSDTLKMIFGDAISRDFIRTLFVFTAAAFVHSRQVRKEIREQIGALIRVLEDDLRGQKFLIGKLDERITKLESHKRGGK